MAFVIFMPKNVYDVIQSIALLPNAMVFRLDITVVLIVLVSNLKREFEFTVCNYKGL